MRNIIVIDFNVGCTLSPGALGKSQAKIARDETGQVQLRHSYRELSILVRNMRRQPGETRDPLTRAHRLLKKRDLNEVRHERQGYTRGSKVRQVFPSTLSLSLCFGFPRRECTAGISILKSGEDIIRSLIIFFIILTFFYDCIA